MKKLLIPLLWVGLVLTIAYSAKEAVRAVRETVQWESDTTRLFTQVEVDAIVRDSARVFAVRSDSVAKRLTVIAERQKRSILHLQGIGDSLRGLLTTSTTPQESLSVALGAIETYRVALDTAQAVIDGYRSIVAVRDSQIVQLSRSERLGWKNVDSLTALIRRTPTCRRIPLLGIPVPKMGLGYAVTTGGQGVGIGVMIPLSCK